MNAAALLADLQGRGVELVADGAELRWRAPVGVLRPDDLDQLRKMKPALLAELTEPFSRSADLGGAPVMEYRQGVQAVLLRSPRFGDVWLALEERAILELAAEEALRTEPRPILRAADIANLRGKSDAAIRAALRVAQVMPGSRVLQ